MGHLVNACRPERAGGRLRRIPVLALAAVAVTSTLWAADPVVSNVRAQQLPGSGKVEVLYDLSGAPTQGATVSVVFSADGGGTFGIVPAGGTLSGQVGAGVRNEINRQLVWDAAATLGAGAYGVEYRARVTAVDPGGGGGDEITVTLPGGVPLVLVRIPAGTFMMGSPADERGRYLNEDLRQVTLTQDYYIGKFEVTQGQWQALMGTNPALAFGLGVGPDHPVHSVSWDAIAGPGGFVDTLNAYLGTTKFRLPTEAEWEWAARAGTQTAFSFGDDLTCNIVNDCSPCDLFDQFMWWCGNSTASGCKPVGSKGANAVGLHDMHGSLREWVQDWYTESLGTSPVPDPTGPSTGTDRVYRGGSWAYSAQFCRSASRWHDSPGDSYFDRGFRLARSP